MLLLLVFGCQQDETIDVDHYDYTEEACALLSSDLNQLTMVPLLEEASQILIMPSVEEAWLLSNETEDGFLTILHPQNVVYLLFHVSLLTCFSSSYICCVLGNVTEDSRSVQTTWRKNCGVEIHLLCTGTTTLLANINFHSSFSHTSYLFKSTHELCAPAAYKFSHDVSCIPAILHLRKYVNYT